MLLMDAHLVCVDWRRRTFELFVLSSLLVQPTGCLTTKQGGLHELRARPIDFV